MRQVRPKKFLGQHFLTDLGIAQDIADTVDACPDLPVLEVGPGMGVMTQFLVRKPRLVKVVEILVIVVKYQQILTQVKEKAEILDLQEKEKVVDPQEQVMKLKTLLRKLNIQKLF